MSFSLSIPCANEIRDDLAQLYEEEQFIICRDGQKTLELVCAQFFADEETIFGKVNHDYIEKEILWYLSQSLNVYDFPGGPPKVWKEIAGSGGIINSNYGWTAFSLQNHNQFLHCSDELLSNPNSRRAVIIYNRPSMWIDYNLMGKNDFICTNVVQYFIRENRLHCGVQMRSCDAWSGYRNDLAWQKYILAHLHSRLKEKYLDLEIGEIIWNCGSFHLYEKQFYLVKHYIETGDFNVTKEEVDAYTD